MLPAFVSPSDCVNDWADTAIPAGPDRLQVRLPLFVSESKYNNESEARVNV